MKYKIYEETPAGKNLTLVLIFPDGEILQGFKFVIDEDGMYAEGGAIRLNYLDDKTEYVYEPEN